MIVTVGGIKGGIGKSTLAVNLAVQAAKAGRNVVLVDTDPQKSAVMWAAARSENSAAKHPVTTVALIGAHVGRELQRLEAMCGTVIVDAAARDSNTQRAALLVSHLALLPLPPRGFDLWTLEDMALMLRAVRVNTPGLRAAVFLNRADPAGQDNAEAVAAFTPYAADMDAPPVRIGTRKALASSSVQGLAACEQARPDPKAVAELAALFKYVEDTAGTP